MLDPGGVNLFKAFFKVFLAATALAMISALAPVELYAAQLSSDARGAIPHDVQQLVAIDYRVMQNSSSAMGLRERVMPPELKQFDEALRKSGLNGSEDFDQFVDQLAFALYRPRGEAKGEAKGGDSDVLATVGVAQGQFPMADILANFRKQKIKPLLVRTNKLYAMGKTGMVACFVDPSTMVFGSNESVRAALDARDGTAPSLLTNAPMMDAMKTVDAAPLWSILDQKGTQTMMRQILGEAGKVTDFETVRKRLVGSWYSMDFQHGVKFDLTISTGDSFTSATIASLLSAAVAYRKVSGSEPEKQALTATDVQSDAGRLSIHFATSDTEFISLMQSPLFQSMVH
jgi:hypothetical protein